MSGRKEQVYDERINPLMAEIIAICKTEGITFSAQAALDPNEDNEPLLCTTHIVAPDATEQERQRATEVLRAMKPSPAFMAFTITKAGQ